MDNLTDCPNSLHTPPLSYIETPLTEEACLIVAPLRQQWKDFVSICDSLIALHHKEELSSAERAIVEFYIKELPALLKEKGS